MGGTSTFLDLSAWAPVLGPVFRQALDPATPVKAHRDLAEKASECLEEGALLGDRAVDGEAPWRALMTGNACFLALEDGFALARFDAANMVSLRVETYAGRRWAVQHTGRGLGAFRQAALKKGPSPGPDPLIRISAFGDQRLLFSHVFHPGGTGMDEPVSGSPAAGLGLALAPDFGPELLGARTLLMRRALEYGGAAPAPFQAAPVPRPPAMAVPAPAPPLPAPPSPPPAPLSPPAAPAPSAAAGRARWRLVCMSGAMVGQALPVAAQSVIGRDPGVELPIDNVTVSRRHAEVRPTEVGMVLKDLGSANGTWFENAQLQAPVLLKSGDTFTLGECIFKVERL